MKLLGSTERKITEYISNESMPYLKIAEIIIIHFESC